MGARSTSLAYMGEGARRWAVVELEVLFPAGRFTAGHGQSAVRRRRGPQPRDGRIHPDKERRDVCATRDFLDGHPFKNAQRVTRLESISRIIASAVLLGWLHAAQKSPFLIFGPAAAIFRLAPVWHQAYAPCVMIILAGMVQAGINLLRPDWIRFRSAVRAGMSAITIVVVYFLVRAHEWVVLATPAGNASGDYRRAMEIINQSIYWSLLLTGLIAILLLLRDFWRLVHASQGQGASRG